MKKKKDEHIQKNKHWNLEITDINGKDTLNH